MTRKRAIALIIVALFVGIAGGGIAVGIFFGRFGTELAVSSAAADAGIAIHVLERLRAGNTDEAVELLETKLDGSLFILGSSLSAIPKARRNPLYFKILRMAGEYRRKFPRKSRSPEIDKGVAEALAMADER